MTVAAAFPAAAQRLARWVSGRRALRVGVFVGALFALGLLFGGRAQAADGGPQRSDAVNSTTSSTESSNASTAEGSTKDASPPEQSLKGDASDDVEKSQRPEHPRSAEPQSPEQARQSEQSEQSEWKSEQQHATGAPKRESVREPAGQFVHGVPDGSESARGSGVVDSTERATASTTASTAVSTAVSVGRSATGELARTVEDALGLLSEGVARELPEPRFPRPSLPGLDEPGPGRGTPTPGPDRATPQDREHGDRAGGEARKVRPDSAYQLRDRRNSVAADAERGQREPSGRDSRRPQPQLPFDVPHGPYGIAAQAASDGGSQRHGELHAATPAGGPSFRLVPGEGAGQAYYPTRDRHRDILEFPG